MSGWGTNDGAANRIKQTYVKGFLDISGGALIVEKSSSLQIKAHDSDKSVIEFKSDHFTVNTTSAIDVSYSSLATLGLLGVSFEQSTEALIGRVKYITSDETGGVFSTSIGNDDEHLKLFIKQKDSESFSAIGFGLGKKIGLAKNRHLFEAAYCIEENEWNGRVSKQLRLKDIRKD